MDAKHIEPRHIEPHVRSLRCYARALIGSSVPADRLIVDTLQDIVATRPSAMQDLGPRLAIFAAFHRVWARREAAAPADAALAPVDARLQGLSPICRAAVLLTALAGFSTNEAAVILGLLPREVEMLSHFGCNALERDLLTDVMIIEDSSLVALDLRRALSELGHRVVAVAATRQQAVQMAQKTRPGLVLADIGLADGSSGLDAVSDIQRSINPAVVYVTAYPDRLAGAKGLRSEFVVAKPLVPAALKTVVHRALFLHRPS